jgi:hypothetical protein
MSRSSRRTVLSGLLLWAALGVGCGVSERNLAPQGVLGPRARVSEANPGQVVQLEAEVVDREGDPLTFQWTQTPVEPAGTFSDAAQSSPTWTAPEVATATSFRLKLRVEDDDGNVLEGTTNVLVRPRAPSN